tara:strand:+ start:518 stop:664 length:147 start_codon:yes stop_codon:yes gene_type:complete
MIELTCKKCDDVKIMCDEGTSAVTCSLCSMIDVTTLLSECDTNEIGIA